MANNNTLSVEVKNSGAGPWKAAILIWNDPPRDGYMMVTFEGAGVVDATRSYLHRLIADAALALQELER